MKILFIVEKTSLGKCLLDCFKKYPDIFKDEYFIDVGKPVLHLNDKFIFIRKRNDIFYINRKKSNFECLKLKNIEIPENTFITSNESFGYNNDYLLNEVDSIIFVPDIDFCGMLKALKYIEDHNMSLDIPYVRINDYTEESIKKTFSNLNNLQPFNEFFNEVKDKLTKNNFETQYKREKNPLYLRIESNMKRTEFAKYFNIPYRTLENWECKKATCPEYLYDLMEFKLEQKGLLYEEEEKDESKNTNNYEKAHV